MKILVLITSVLLLVYNTKAQNACTITEGHWVGSLQLNNTTKLPFNFVVEQNKNEISFTVLNGKEEIKLRDGVCKNDSFYLVFPVFNTELVFKITDSKTLTGYWNNNTKTNYHVPFNATFNQTERFSKTTNEEPLIIDGRWETMFTKNGIDEYPALGVFHQKGTSITGTFLTETGDYRFLEGNVYGNQLFLSCFDGAHAFLFTAIKNEQDMLIGDFYSGKHWKSEWTSIKNNDFELQSPDSITYVQDSVSSLTFNLSDINGKMYAYPNKQTENKVVIIQILGTWCPNCMDETRYYKELYKKYHKDGLEIISVGYEVGDDPRKHMSAINTYQKKLDLDFTFLVGGQANKGIASEQFSILNEVVSFPTSIFIGRDGKIKRVHTGFNGPSTGIYYEEYILKTEKLIRELLTN